MFFNAELPSQLNMDLIRVRFIIDGFNNTFRSVRLSLKFSSLHMFLRGKISTNNTIVLESCSNPQKIRKVFASAMKQIFCFGFQVFCE